MHLDYFFFPIQAISFHVLPFCFQQGHWLPPCFVETVTKKQKLVDLAMSASLNSQWSFWHKLAISNTIGDQFGKA